MKIKHKSLFIFPVLLFCTIFSANAIPKLNTSGLKDLDLPFVWALDSIGGMLYKFMSLAITLCTLFAFLCVVFNAFKLWAGTIELKKMFIDILYKCVMCIMLMNFYPTITNKILDFGCQIGIKYSGGYYTLNQSFVTLAEKIKTNWDTSMNEVFNLLTAGEKAGSNSYLSDETYNNLLQCGKTEDEIKQWAATNGFNFVTENVEYLPEGGTYTYYTDSKGDVVKNQSFLGGIYSSWTSKRNTDKANKVLKGKNVTVKDANGNKKVISGKMLQQSLKILNAMMQVMGGVDNSELSKDDSGTNYATLLSKGDKAFKEIFYNPYITDSDGKTTTLISPSSMLKTAILIADICSFSVSHYYDEKKGTFETIKLGEDGKGWLMDAFSRIIKYIVYWLGMILSVILIMCEYCMMFIEYQFVTSVSVILIPFLFLDATKSYASNILRTFLTYFMKTVVVITCCFFTMGMYITLGMNMLTKTDLEASSSITLYLFTLVLGLVLCTNAGKIASTVMSGNPSLGAGDVTQQFRNGMHTMHDAQHMAHMGASAVKGLAHGAQGVVKGGMGAAATLDGMRSAFNSTKEGLSDMQKSGEWSGGEGAKWNHSAAAALGVGAAAIGQSFKDKAYKAFTGEDRLHIDEKNNEKDFIKLGQNVGHGELAHKATFGDLTEQSSKKGNEAAQLKLESISKKEGNKNNAGETNGRLKSAPDPVDTSYGFNK